MFYSYNSQQVQGYSISNKHKFDCIFVSCIEIGKKIEQAVLVLTTW